MKRALRPIGWGLALLTLGAAAVIAVLSWQINRLGSQDQARPADAIVILGARVKVDGSPGSDLLSRTFHAMDLYNAGLAPLVICAGGLAGDPLSAAAVACRFAVEQLALPADKALLAQNIDAYTTADEAAAVAELMRARGLRTAILVSHPLHLYRARWLFQRQGLTVYTSPTNTDLWRILPPLRAWYTMREAGGIILIMSQDWLGVGKLMSRLNGIVYGRS